MSIGSTPPPPPPPDLFDDWIRVAQANSLSWTAVAAHPGLGRLVQTSGANAYLYLSADGVTMDAELSGGVYSDLPEMLMSEAHANIALTGKLATTQPSTDIEHGGKTYAFRPANEGTLAVVAHEV